MFIVHFIVCLMHLMNSVFFCFSKLSKAFPDEGLDHFLPQSAELDPRFEPHSHLRICSYVLFFFSVGAEVEFVNLEVFSGLPVLNISHICRADVGVSEPCSAHVSASCTVSSLCLAG